MPGAAHTIQRLSLVASLVGLLLLSSSLIALRGLIMAHPQDNPAKNGHAMHHGAKADQARSPEHCLLCFTHLVEASSLEDALVRRASPRFASHLWLGQAGAKDEFLKSIAARGPPA